MNQLIINDTEIFFNIFGDGFEILFQDETTGLEKAIVCEAIHIYPNSKYIKTDWVAFDITPTGRYINRKAFPRHLTQGPDYEYFTEAFGLSIKKYAINGLFQQFMHEFNLSSAAIYDQGLALITQQPVPFPEPIVDDEEQQNLPPEGV